MRRYELRDEEWNRINDLLPSENTGKKGRPRGDNRIMLNSMLWIARSGCQWRELPEYFGKVARSIYSIPPKSNTVNPWNCDSVSMHIRLF
ncbi:MAG: transposase [Clostridiaceae bacterium]|jgi:transposase|nr:transposase [Clostridiaceae bacterium]